MRRHVEPQSPSPGESDINFGRAGILPYCLVSAATRSDIGRGPRGPVKTHLNISPIEKAIAPASSKRPDADPDTVGALGGRRCSIKNSQQPRPSAEDSGDQTHRKLTGGSIAQGSVVGVGGPNLRGLLRETRPSMGHEAALKGTRSPVGTADTPGFAGRRRLWYQSNSDRPRWSRNRH